MRIGYARVSTVGQSFDEQVERLTAEGCEKIFSEKISGAKRDRPELAEAIDFASAGDTFMVTKLDRLARSTFELTQIGERLKDKGVGFVVVDQPEINTTTPTGQLVYTILGALGQFERDLIVTRTGEGRKAAIKKGVRFGRKPQLKTKQIKELRVDFKAGVERAELAKKYKLSVSSVYRLCSNPAP